MPPKKLILRREFLLTVWLVGILATGIGAESQAADHFVPLSVSSIDCGASGVEPGDTITLKAGDRGNISFNNCFGKRGSNITIRNDSGAAMATIIHATGAGWPFECNNCEFVTINGAEKWTGAGSSGCGMKSSWPQFPKNPQCGIQIVCTSGSPNSLVKMRGSSKNYTITGVEIDGDFGGACGNGIQALSTNDHSYVAPGEWREGILLTDNYIHNTSRTGMYIGPNAFQETDLRNRDNEISYNYMHDLGCDGIKYKSAVGGKSSIHHNYVDTTGLSGDETSTGCTDIGIALFESGFTDVYNNTVMNTARSGIAQFVQSLSKSQYPTLPASIYNNTVWQSGANGINSNRQDSTDSLPQATIFNNTVVASASVGINVGSSISSGCSVLDNIVASAAEGDFSTGQCSQSNNIGGTTSKQKFVNAQIGNFKLTSESPARNGGSSNSVSTTDHDGLTRPQEGIGDQGAFEFVLGGESSIPKPPSGFEVF